MTVQTKQKKNLQLIKINTATTLKKNHKYFIPIKKTSIFQILNLTVVELMKVCENFKQLKLFKNEKLIKILNEA